MPGYPKIWDYTMQAHHTLSNGFHKNIYQRVLAIQYAFQGVALISKGCTIQILSLQKSGKSSSRQYMSYKPPYERNFEDLNEGGLR